MKLGVGGGNILGAFNGFQHKRRGDADIFSIRFGTIALLLQLIPIASMFFLLTTACGSALWVVKLEEQKRLIPETPVVEEEAPPVYTDDPI